MAGGAFAAVQKLADFVAYPCLVGLQIAAVHGVDDAFVGRVPVAHRAACADGRHRDFVAAAAVEDEVLDGVRQVFKGGGFEVEVVVRGECLHLRVEVGRAPVPAAHCAGGDGEVGVHDDAARVDEGIDAEAVAFGAGAVRVVKGKEARLQLAQGVAADRAGVFGGEGVLRVAVHCHQLHDAVGKRQRRFQRFGKALRDALADGEAIDDDADVVFAAAVNGGQGVQLVNFAVNTRADEALLLHVLQQLGVLTLAPPHQRRDQHPFAAFRKRQDVIHHLADGLRVQLDAVVGAARNADARKEQAQIVVDFGNGADGGARVVRGGFLLDRNRRRKAFDVIDVWLVHDGKELARVGRERLDVAPLPLGVDGVKGERGLAAAGKAGDDNHAVARQVEVNVFQVVGARAANGDGFHGNSG